MQTVPSKRRHKETIYFGPHFRDKDLSSPGSYKDGRLSGPAVQGYPDLHRRSVTPWPLSNRT